MSALNDALNQGLVDFDLLHNFIQGDTSTSVPTDGGDIPSLSKIVLGIYDRVLSSLSATSPTAQTVTVGELSFMVQQNKSFTPGQPVVIVNPRAHLTGTVVSYSGTTLVVNVTQIQGTGTYDNWIISFSGPAGPKGIDGDILNPINTLLTKMPWE